MEEYGAETPEIGSDIAQWRTDLRLRAGWVDDLISNCTPQSRDEFSSAMAEVDKIDEDLRRIRSSMQKRLAESSSSMTAEQIKASMDDIGGCDKALTRLDQFASTTTRTHLTPLTTKLRNDVQSVWRRDASEPECSTEDNSSRGGGGTGREALILEKREKFARWLTALTHWVDQALTVPDDVGSVSLSAPERPQSTERLGTAVAAFCPAFGAFAALNMKPVPQRAWEVVKWLHAMDETHYRKNLNIETKEYSRNSEAETKVLDTAAELMTTAGPVLGKRALRLIRDASHAPIFEQSLVNNAFRNALGIEPDKALGQWASVGESDAVQDELRPS